MKHSVFSLIKDIKAFQNITKVREAHFAHASAAPVAAPQGAIALARELHPDSLSLTVSEKRENKDGTLTLLLRGTDGSLPVFRPGQFIHLLCGDRLYPFFLSGSPAAALGGEYEILAEGQTSPDAFAFLAALAVGETLTAGAPTGYFYRQPLRDGDAVAVIADRTGSGAACSMKNNDNAAVFLCSGAEDIPDGGEIAAETVFICGRRAFCEKAAAAVAGRRIRTLFTDLPERDVPRETYTCTVLSGDERAQFDCFSDEPLINALERNRRFLFNKCRTGDCAFCRARLTEGQVTHVFDADDSRRKADVKFGYIHPCRAFPDGNVTLKY